MLVRLRHGGELRVVRLEKEDAALGDRRVRFRAARRDGRIDSIVIGDRAHRVLCARDGDRVFVWCDGATFCFELVRGALRAGAAEHGADLVAPMPGRVRRIFGAVGGRVARGEVLMVLEAMKMEHSIRAPQDGVLRRVCVREGDLVEAGVELAEIAVE